MHNNLVVLDRDKHKTLKIKSLEDMSHVQDRGFIPTVASEIALVGSDFPVVFTTSNGVTSLVLLTSLGGRNLAVNDEKKWISPYIPLFVRKDPFYLANNDSDKDRSVVMIDETSKRFSKSKGKQLFKKNTDQSDTLKEIINTLSTYMSQMNITHEVAKIIESSGILEEKNISIGNGDNKKTLVQGFLVVNREKLNALSDEVLSEWVRKGIITLIEFHLRSLENVQKLFHLAQSKQNNKVEK